MLFKTGNGFFIIFSYIFQVEPFIYYFHFYLIPFLNSFYDVKNQIHSNKKAENNLERQKPSIPHFPAIK